MRKIISLFFIVFIIISIVFIGCSSPTDSNQVTEESISENMEISDNEDEETTEESSDVLDNLANLFAKTENFMDRGLAYTQTFKMDTDTTTMKIWMKGELYKTQNFMDGIEVISINDFENEEYITYYPQEKTGMRFKTDLSESMFDDEYIEAEGFEEQVDTENYEYIGRETINGEKCYVVITRDLESLEIVTMWISEKYGIPMRIEMKDSEFGDDYIIEVNDISEGVSDKEFEIPSDIVIQNMG